MNTRHTLGFTMLEILIALVIFGIIAAVATQGVTSALQAQAVNEAGTATQAKLRRVTEVLTQELRSAVLGGISNYPVASGEQAISFALLDGGAGYAVLPDASDAAWANSANLVAVAPVATVEDLGIEDEEVLLINGSGHAVILPITNVQRIGGPSNAEYNVVHTGCKKGIGYDPGNTLIFAVRAVGFSYDPDTRVISQTLGEGDPTPFAFDISSFRVEYIYEPVAGGVPIIRTAPITEDGVPLRRGDLAGVPVTLQRLQVIVGATTTVGGREVERTYAGQVEMSGNDGSSFAIDGVKRCE